MIIVQTDQQLVDHLTTLVKNAKGHLLGLEREKGKRGVTKIMIEKQKARVVELEEVLELVKTHQEQAQWPTGGQL